MIRETLYNLPEGLGGTYKRILVTIGRSPLRARLARKMFQWATVAQRPLHVEELKEAVAFSPQDKHWEQDKIPNEDLMFESCRGLIIKDEDDGTVRFAHHTVRQYLIGGLATKVDPTFEVSTWNAETLAAWTCVAYLSFFDFETQLTSNTAKISLEPKGVLQSGGPLWIPSVLGIRRPMFNIPYKLLRGVPSSQPSEFDYWKHLRPQPKPKCSPSTDLKDKYRLLCYAIKNWEPHTRSVHTHDDTVYARRLENLAKHKTLAFDFRPWGPNQHFGPYGCIGCPNSSDQSPVAKDLPYISMVHFAARVGNLMLLKSHDSTEMKLKDYLHHERYHQETLLIACRHNRIKVVEYLVQQAEYDVSDGRAVDAAAAAGHADVLHYLLGLGQYQVKQQGHIPLLLAAKNGHEAIILLLAEAGVDFFAYEERNIETIAASEDLSDYDIQTATAATYLAARNGHVEATRRLLECVSPKSHDTALHALHVAAELGHSAVVEVLLNNGISLDILVDETPVHLAAKRGHVNILESINKWHLIRETPRNKLGQTPLHLAILGGQDEAIRWLVENGVDVNAKDGMNQIPLCYAGIQNNETAVLLLLEHGATVFDAIGVSGETRLNSKIISSAAEDGSLVNLQTLLEIGRKDRQLPNSFKPTVIFDILHDARIRGNMEAAELLEQALLLYSKGKSYEEMCLERGIPIPKRSSKILGLSTA